jgi:hypothetical protein
MQVGVLEIRHVVSGQNFQAAASFKGIHADEDSEQISGFVINRKFRQRVFR